MLATERGLGGGRDFIAGLAKGLAVIELFDDEHERLTIAETAAMSGLSSAAARRSLHTLARLGYVAFDGKFFTLTARVLKLGHAFLSSTPLPQLFQPFLEEVSEQVHESCSAAVLDGDEIVYIARSATKRIMSVGVTVGSRLPAYCTSMGRVLLAGLDPSESRRRIERAERRRLTPRTHVSVAELTGAVADARGQGFAIVDQELEMGLTSIAVPVLNRRGTVVAAFNVGVQSQRVGTDTLRRDVLPRLLAMQERLRPLVR